MPYSFISGSSEDENGKIIAAHWQKWTGKKLYAPFGVIGIVNKDWLVAIVLLTEYTGSNVEIHYVGEGSINKQVLGTIAKYIFNELKCNVIRVKPHSSTPKLIDYVRRLGFKQECTLIDYYDIDDHAIVFKMDKLDAKRWLK